MSDVPKIEEGTKLEDMHFEGFAPFFGRTDLSRGGNVYVHESTGRIRFFAHMSFICTWHFARARIIGMFRVRRADSRHDDGA